MVLHADGGAGRLGLYRVGERGELGLEIVAASGYGEGAACEACLLSAGPETCRVFSRARSGTFVVATEARGPIEVHPSVVDTLLPFEDVTNDGVEELLLGGHARRCPPGG